ncbi:MAG: oxygen-independent coproporphyrinogen III oxidase [Caulobacteraceae bacterium]
MNIAVTDPHAALIRKYGGGAPRYTSYPTAVQFTGDVNAQVHSGWLSEIDPARPVSLYAHLPFCPRLCWYCGCNTRAVRHQSTVTDYVELLIKEIATARGHLPAMLRAHALHLGGGTPNMTSPSDLQMMFEAFREAFHIDASARISAEMDPVSLTESWVKAATAEGLNRASLGVQDLDPKVQAAVNRLEGFDVLQRAFGWLRDNDVDSINFDLMYGLPLQTTAGVAKTLETVLTLRPDRIALFGYAHVPWMKAHQKLINEGDLPGPEERLAQSEMAARILVDHGYVPIGMDHFALPEDSLARAATHDGLRRNFQGYTDDAAASLIGFGASAISRLPGGYAQNLTGEVAWRAAVRAGRLPTARGVPVTAEDRLRGAVIEQLMCAFRADVGAIRARVDGEGVDLSAAFDTLRELEADGLVALEGEVVALTEKGRPFLRAACLAFDQYFDASAGRHSKAI